MRFYTFEGKGRDDQDILDAEIVKLTEDEGSLVHEIEQADIGREALYEAVLKVDKVLDVKPPVHATQLKLRRLRLEPRSQALV